MKTTGLITRRRAIITGFAAAGGLILTRFPKNLPPAYGNLLRMGDTLTYAAHRTLLPGQSLVKEFSPKDITSFPATGTTNPGVSEKSALGDAWNNVPGDVLATDALASKPISMIGSSQKFFRVVIP